MEENGRLWNNLAHGFQSNSIMTRKYVIRKQDKVSQRRAKRSQVIMLAECFHVDEKEMLTLWLADKILDALEGEDELGLCAIETAKSKLATGSFPNESR